MSVCPENQMPYIPRLIFQFSFFVYSVIKKPSINCRIFDNIYISDLVRAAVRRHRIAVTYAAFVIAKVIHKIHC